jgi:hypothetical protein
MSSPTPSGLYPTRSDARTRQLVKDGLVVVLVLVFVWVGVRVHHLIAELAVLGRGVRTSGESIEGGFETAAGAVSRVPIVGDRLADALTSAGSGTGGELADLGQSGIDAVNRLAWGVGILVAGLPIAVLLVAYLPRRIRAVRERRAVLRVTRGLELDPERRRLLAMRAAFALPYHELLQFTPDPLGDLAAGRTDALVEAALADVGLDVTRRLA